MTTIKSIQRLVVVVDIRTWVLNPHPADLAHLLQRIVRRFLHSASPFCRWAFKLFDSSLSPFSSRCKVNKLLGSWACSTRFDSVLPGGDDPPTLPEVLSQFCSALNCLHTEIFKTAGASANETPAAAASANYVASSLQELLVDYTWDPLLPSLEDVAVNGDDVVCVQSNTNLVILVSTIPSTQSELKQFLGLGFDSSEKGLPSAFSSCFKKVHDSFASNSIHLCWVHMPLTLSTINNGQDVICNETTYNKLQFVRLLENLGWSFTSLDVLFTGLQLLPFSIVWKSLAHPLFQFSSKPAAGIQKLCIQVKDVNSKPINTTLCKVEPVPIGGKELGSQLSRSVIWVSATISRKALDLALHSPIFLAILRPHVSEKAKLEKFDLMLEDEKDRHLVGDYILRQLQQEGRAFEPGKPAWQLFLLHLAREERLAIIDLRANRLSYFAIIEPLTVHLAVLRVFDKRLPCDTLGSLSGIRQEALVRVICDEDSRPDSDFTSAASAEFVSQEAGFVLENEGCKTTESTGSRRSQLIACSNEKDSSGCKNVRKRIRPSCPAKTEEDPQPTAKMSLEELYLRSNKRSKVLKVFSCWMKQTKEDNIKPPTGTNYQQLSEDNPDQLVFQTVSGATRNDDQNIKPFLRHQTSDDCAHVNDPVEVHKEISALDINLLDSSVSQESNKVLGMQDSHLCDGKEILHDSTFDDANAYIASLEKKIAHSLSSPEIDLHCFCQRVVTDAYQAFSVVLIRVSENEGGCQRADAAIGSGSGAVVKRLSEALLQSPKKLASKYKKCSPPGSDSQGADSQSESRCSQTSEEKVREHELQILFRMEIISLILAVSELKDLIHGFVNDICKLLENIQFNLPGGILEGETLFEFSNVAIKERYGERLPDIVKDIYINMEFNGHDGLSETEEVDPTKNTSDLIPSFNDAPNSLGTQEDSFCNSDNSRDSCSQKKVKTNSRDVPLQRTSFSQRNRCVAEVLSEELRLAEAKRERAKRFSHFANSSRDLLRVIVTPKLNISSKKHMKSNSECSDRKIHMKFDSECSDRKTHMKSNSECTDRKKRRSKSISDREVIVETPIQSGRSRHSKGISDREVIMETPIQSRMSRHESSKKTLQDKEIIVQTPLQQDKQQSHDPPPVGAKKKLLV